MPCLSWSFTCSIPLLPLQSDPSPLTCSSEKNHLQEARFQLLDLIHKRFLDALALFIWYRQIRIPLVLLGMRISLAFFIRRPKPARPNTADLERRCFAFVPVEDACD